MSKPPTRSHRPVFPRLKLGRTIKQITDANWSDGSLDPEDNDDDDADFDDDFGGGEDDAPAAAAAAGNSPKRQKLA